MYNPLKSIEINYYRFFHPDVDKFIDGFRIAQISDVHNGRWVRPRHIRQVVDFVNDQHPEFVALTGDYVGYNPQDFAPGIEMLGELDARSFAVLGNHDHWTCPDTAIENFSSVDIPVLSNQAVMYDEFPTPIEIVGIDDHVTENSDVEQAFDEVRGDSLCIALNHVPRIADRIATRGADLILSGHTHGHQFNIPRLTEWVADKFGFRYHVGAYDLDGSFLYVNRGLGSSSIPLRIGAAPEVTFFDLASGPGPRLELIRSDEFSVIHRPDRQP